MKEAEEIVEKIKAIRDRIKRQEKVYYASENVVYLLDKFLEWIEDKGDW